MAGCYGNHPFDRIMESQLFRWLDSEEKSLNRRICLQRRRYLRKKKRNENT